MTESFDNNPANGLSSNQFQPAETVRPIGRRPMSGAVDSGHVIIGSGARLQGAITKCSVLEVKGYADGEFAADRVLVHEDGELHGRVDTSDATVSGILEGTVVVANVLDIKEKGSVSGDLTYCELSVEAGGSMTGNVSVARINDDNNRANGIADGTADIARQSAHQAGPANREGSMLALLTSSNQASAAAKTTLGG